MSTTPSGWYPDPATPGQQRWWDEAAGWTSRVHPTEPAGSSEPAAPPQESGPAEQHTDPPTWRVRRRVLPWRVHLRARRTRRVAGKLASTATDGLYILGGPAEAGSIIGAIVLVLALGLILALAVAAALFVPILVVFVIEVAVVGVAGACVWVWRVVRGEPWPVEARRDKQPAGEWLAPSWRSAGVWARYLEAQLNNGGALPPPGALTALPDEAA